MGFFNRKKKQEEEEQPKKSTPEQKETLDEFAQQMSDAAEACADHFKGRYGVLDFSERSLQIVDTILEDASDFYPEMEEAQQQWIVSSVGSYIFEVARRNFGGKYFWFDQRAQPILVTGQPRFEISIVVFDKVAGRLTNGKEDNIPYFFEGYAERVRKAKDGDRATIV
ncbi:hypothetical protein [Chryseolinea soli]|uniref:DUF3806 domain-containing protein n=1 Tax=Chryseolinea soli TaxID=2321403 RepID=A0A385SVM8_9BACT|nr:hypothetical protein [Chryseolinea soli]AYB35004.1 hypothetical protein D4L85_32430 [Chryseolinea soli]